MMSSLRFMFHNKNNGDYKAIVKGTNSLLGFPCLNCYSVDGKMSVRM